MFGSTYENAKSVSNSIEKKKIISALESQMHFIGESSRIISKNFDIKKNLTFFKQKRF